MAVRLGTGQLTLPPRVTLATAVGFRAIGDRLEMLGWSLVYSTPWTARCRPPVGAEFVIQMGMDLQLASADRWILCCSWFGLVWLQHSVASPHPALSQSIYVSLAQAYIQSFHLSVVRPDLVSSLMEDTRAASSLLPYSGSTWGITVLLTMIAATAQAGATVGMPLPDRHGKVLLRVTWC